MSRRYLRALWIAMIHVAVLTAAHNVAEVMADVGKEMAGLVRDELALDAVIAVTAKGQ
jgi:hypothetical protein